MGNTPNIRFKGFTDDWEQRKLGDMGSTFTGLSGKTKEDFGHGDAQFITYMNVFSNPVANLEMTEAVEIDANQNSVKKGDVFFTTSSETPEEVGMSCVMPENKDNIYLNSFCFGYRPTEKFDLDYLAYVLRADSFRKEMTFLAQGISRYNISKNKVMEVSIPVPNLEEQTMIGRYFSTLDHLITLHQRKCDETKKLKKFMLQKMFPKKDAKKPEIRFAGFTDDWEQRKLGDNIVEYTEVTTENNQYPPLTSSRKGIFLQTKYFAGNQIASDDNTGYNIVPYGYFTYRHMSDDEIFHFNINDIVENGIVSTLYPVFTTDENLDSRYLQYQLNYGHEFAKFAILQKQGGSRTYMYLNKLKQLYLTMPKSVEEQKAISAFFMNLDHLITLHRRAYYNKKGGLTNVHNDNQQHYAIL